MEPHHRRVVFKDATYEEEGVEWTEKPKKDHPFFMGGGHYKGKQYLGLTVVLPSSNTTTAPCLSTFVLELLSADLISENPFSLAGTPTNKHPKG
jgi:hypothetical protein